VGLESGGRTNICFHAAERVFSQSEGVGSEGGGVPEIGRERSALLSEDQAQARVPVPHIHGNSKQHWGSRQAVRRGMPRLYAETVDFRRQQPGRSILCDRPNNKARCARASSSEQQGSLAKARDSGIPRKARDTKPWLQAVCGWPAPLPAARLSTSAHSLGTAKALTCQWT